MARKKINLVYAAHKGEPSVHYDGPEGRVQIWYKISTYLVQTFPQGYEDYEAER